ncbi:MAG: M28 family peptidase [Clostridia bacterium]
MKRFLSLLLSICIITLIPIPVKAEQRIFKVQNANGDIFAVGQKEIQGEIYLPLRTTCELLGYDVFWVETDRSVIITGNNAVYVVKPGSRECVTKNGTVPLIRAPEIIDGSTYAPLYLFLNVMGVEYVQNQDILKKKPVVDLVNVRVLNRIDEYKILDHIRSIAGKERLAGTKNENDTADYLYDRFRGMGYTVEQQSFRIYGNYLIEIPTVNRLQLIGIPGKGFETSVVMNSKNGYVKGQLVWYDEATDYKDKIVIIDTYNYLFYQYLDLIAESGALAVIMLGEAYENIMYGLYEEDKVLAIGVDRSHITELREIVKNNVKVYAEIEVRNGNWYGTSRNIIAKKHAPAPADEILLVTAHYDTAKGSNGANDNGSGIGVLLAVAESVVGIPGDLEVWFVALGGNKQDQVGSNAFLSELDDKTKDKIIGCINLDMLADAEGGRFNIYTVDGRKNIVSYFMERASYRQFGEPLHVHYDMVGDHRTFSVADIPSVQLSQDRIQVEYFNRKDNIENINPEYLKKAARIVADALYGMLSKDTPSLRILDKGYNIMSKRTFSLSIRALFPYRQSVKDVEEELGIFGELEPNPEGITKLKYNIKWFDDMKTDTFFVYDYFGLLQSVEIRFTDKSVEKVLEVLYGQLGNPVDRSHTTFGWTSIYGNYYDYDFDKNVLSIYPFVPEDRIIAIYPVSERIIETDNAAHAKLWDLITGIMRPQDIDYISRFAVFTDYLGNKTGYIKRDLPNYRRTDKAEFICFLDYYDIFNESGNYRSYDQTVRVLIHEYGHLLTLNENQMDPEGTEERPIGYNGGKFKEGSIVDAFYNRFWADCIVYWENMNANDFYNRMSDAFVTKYAATKCSEDICETFAEFVLRNKPEGKTVAEQKILFFYEYEEMIEVRNHIRKFLNIEKK